MTTAARTKPVTIDRIERAMDGLAAIILAWKDDGKVFLPIYARLERELAQMRENDRMMSDITDRVRRSRDRTAGRSC